jgi:hypothetical protein
MPQTIKTHRDGSSPSIASGFIFVFGSNLRGHHGGGAARAAMDKFKAEYGVANGLTGQSYAIPTKDRNIETLPLKRVEKYVKEFCKFAASNPDKKFFITRVGCVLAGYKDEDIAPLFYPPLPNCNYPENWLEWLED